MDAMTGMIFMVPFDWAPRGWLTCQGQILNIQQYQAVFSLIGNIYGGDMLKGTFGLPNLSGRTAIGAGQSTFGPTKYAVSKAYGTETSTLTVDNVPPHLHPATFTPTYASQSITIPAQPNALTVTLNAATGAISTGTPSSSAMLANGGTTKLYGAAPATPPTGLTNLAPASIGVTGTAPTKEQTVSVNTVNGGTVAVGTAGAGTPFSTLQPSLALNFIITMSGLFPQRPD